jgi:hypothetical protein
MDAAPEVAGDGGRALLEIGLAPSTKWTCGPWRPAIRRYNPNVEINI